MSTQGSPLASLKDCVGQTDIFLNGYLTSYLIVQATQSIHSPSTSDLYDTSKPQRRTQAGEMLKTYWLGNIGGSDGATIIGPTVTCMALTSASSATGKEGSPIVLTCWWSAFWAVQPLDKSSPLRMLRAPRQLVRIGDTRLKAQQVRT